ncbi:MAG TPA: hypothetical protein PK971_02825 [Saprospiraceae bacterium]|nr:hypothetical protein [Saprospiraceae bacterium]
MKHLASFFTLTLLSCISCRAPQAVHSTAGFTVEAKTEDMARRSQYVPFFARGQQQVEAFFGKSYARPFTVVIHPSRAALDSCWQQDWKMPDFRSECWMVASGVASRLDLLSPRVWGSASCEHDWQDSIAAQRLITHELVHVYHGQLNPSPDFSDTDRIDWFVEGLAVYASGQCDALRMKGVADWLKDHPAPASLDVFWSGKHKYGLSGSVVMFLDARLGRKALLQMLAFNKKEQVLQAASMTEPELLQAWAEWMRKR